MLCRLLKNNYQETKHNWQTLCQDAVSVCFSFASNFVILERCGGDTASIGSQIKDDRLTELTVGTADRLTIASRGPWNESF
jgi:hypothetical protein